MKWLIAISLVFALLFAWGNSSYQPTSSSNSSISRATRGIASIEPSNSKAAQSPSPHRSDSPTISMRPPADQAKIFHSKWRMKIDEKLDQIGTEMGEVDQLPPCEKQKRLKESCFAMSPLGIAPRPEKFIQICITLQGDLAGQYLRKAPAL